jgi:DNA-binding CsgD family transcriptional regulator
MVVLGPDGCTVQANRAAEQLLNSGYCLRRDRKGRVVAVAPSERAALRAALSAAREKPGGPYLLLHLGSPCRRWVALRTLVAGAALAPVLLVLSPGPATAHDAAAYARAKGLSAAQTRVFAMLAEGLDGPEVADALGIKPATVAAHLRAICRKAAVADLPALCAELSRLPPVLLLAEGN